MFKRKRGRPPKNRVVEVREDNDDDDVVVVVVVVDVVNFVVVGNLK